MVRHDNAVGAAIRGLACVFGIEDAFDDQRSLPLFAHPRDVLPRDRLRRNCARTQPIRSRGSPRSEQRLEIAKGHAGVHGPRRPMPSAAGEALGLSAASSRTGQPGAIIAIAGAGNGRSTVRSSALASRLARSFDHVRDEFAILDDVELEPEGLPAAPRPHRLRRRSASKGRMARRPVPRRAPPEPRPAARRARTGQPARVRPACPALAEQGRREVDRRHVAKHPLPQCDRAQVFDIPSQRLFVVGPAVEIFEQEMRQPRLGERAIVAEPMRAVPSPA